MAHRFEAAPMVEWDRLTSRMTTTEQQRLSDKLAHVAVWSARASAYINRRFTGGKHADAVKAQNRAARGVRQALGYAYADDTVTF